MEYFWNKLLVNLPIEILGCIAVDFQNIWSNSRLFLVEVPNIRFTLTEVSGNILSLEQMLIQYRKKHCSSEIKSENLNEMTDECHLICLISYKSTLITVTVDSDSTINSTMDNEHIKINFSEISLESILKILLGVIFLEATSLMSNLKHRSSNNRT